MLDDTRAAISSSSYYTTPTEERGCQSRVSDYYLGYCCPIGGIRIRTHLPRDVIRFLEALGPYGKVDHPICDPFK
ncbi:hypothetical protein TNCV_2422911 [Trichonephila clavipes]|nr:hypothetical protein TNCV_2422911 [Trichonephila clavipes]